MSHRNLFFGDSYKSQFAVITYQKLMTRQWVSNSDIMAEYLGYNSAEDLPYNISSCDHIVDLKKAFLAVREAITLQIENSIEEIGNRRNKKFRYTGESDDPLADMRNTKVIHDLRKYWKFCQDTAGILPASWMEYFLKDCKDLWEIKTRKKKGEQVISASLDRILTNIDFLPVLYEAIINKQVLNIKYKPYCEEVEDLIFHPHYIKEYNGRWHLLGKAEGHEPELGYDIALDRIQGYIRENNNIPYTSAPTHFYDEYFQDIIGVSHRKNSKKEKIVIKAHSLYVFKLTETKPLHASQQCSKPYNTYMDGEYGVFTLDIEPNIEFFGKVLQMGAGLEIVSPQHIRDEIMDRINAMRGLYTENP